MSTTRVLVSGASIAGPAVAFWLSRYGFEVTVVEKAGAIRPGGQAVDFKGPVQVDLLQRMGLLEAVREADVRDGNAAILNRAGRRVGTAPGGLGAGELNVPRGDLARVLHERTADTCEYVFGDSIAELTETPDGVEVLFASGTHRTFDVVVGADGMHSNVRRLVFGPEERFVRNLGSAYALADLGVPLPDVAYCERGRTMIAGGSKAPEFFVFATPRPVSARDDATTQQHRLAEAFEGAGWRMPELIARLPEAKDFYLDAICRATVDHWSEGRVVLLGDAAWGNALGGYGTGLALTGAYVLAGEMARARDDHAAGFAAFEAKFRDLTSVSEKVDAGRLLAPRTRLGLLARNAAFTIASVLTPLIRLLDRPASAIRLEDYSAELAPAARADTAIAPAGPDVSTSRVAERP